MPSRNPKDFITQAEIAIDSGWRNLPIFKSDRPTALLKLITASDDRIRIFALAGSPLPVLFSSAIRFGQDSINFGIPWIFSSCLQTNNNIPSTLTELDILEGIALAEYSEAYDSARIAFTNYHQGRYTVFVAAKDRRITFTHASPEVDSAERERKAYEMYELDLEAEVASASNTKTTLSLKRMVDAKAVRGVGDRVELTFDNELVEALRAAMDGISKMYETHIDDFQLFAGFEYGKIRRVHAAIVALSYAHFFLHLSPAVSGIVGGAVSSLSFRSSTSMLNDHVAQISGLAIHDAEAISKLLTFDGSVPNMPSICQPLIRANDTELLIPAAYALGSRFERNFLKLLARHPQTKKEYDAFSSQKENIALPRLVQMLHKAKIFVKDRVHITTNGRLVGDIDIVAYDPREKYMLAIQHKWLIEPDSVNESKTCDAELVRAIEQARLAKAHLMDRGFAMRAIPEIPSTGEISVEALVISKGSESTGFVSTTDVPIVTEKWFIENIRSTQNLAAVHKLAISRPDRAEFASKWAPSKVSSKLAGYEIRIPGFSKTV